MTITAKVIKNIKRGTKELIEEINADYQSKYDSPLFEKMLFNSLEWDTCLLCERGHALVPTATCSDCNIFLDRKKFSKKIAIDYPMVIQDTDDMD